MLHIQACMSIRFTGWVAAIVMTVMIVQGGVGFVNTAQAAGGSIKTTTGSCGSPVNKNLYDVGDTMYLTGTGFSHNATLNWSVIGLPGSSDANITVASGTITTDGQGKFCFAAYTIQSGDGGEYKADVNGKSDNFQVKGQSATPTPTPSGTPSPTPIGTPAPSVTPTPLPSPEIHGMKFEDMDGDGVKDIGETGLVNWTINLYDGAMNLLSSTTTDSSGAYQFAPLAPGTYNVREVQQAGWTQTTSNPTSMTLVMGSMAMNVNFGNFKNVSVSGFKQNQNSTNLAGWTIFIDENANMMLDIGEDSMVTTSSLGYTFSDLGPGTYSLCEVIQSGWRPSSGNLCQDVVVNVSGHNLTGVNFMNIEDREGTQGLWRNWNRSNQYTATQINGWLVTIDGASTWLVSPYAPTTSGLVFLINDATKFCSQSFSPLECAHRKFMAQYLVTRLDVLSGRKDGDTWYAVSASAQTLLGLNPMEKLSDIVTATEALGGTLTRDQYLTLAGLFDSINNTGW